ncbi:MAG: FKBP-type peptidyl-prolyl cis-trans isomerase [Gammaproteobacteria bacterium]|nr:FKBP-type peptidyl-prolyl cis-trans isomerase [Gammaproteobacteria bacterium]
MQFSYRILGAALGLALLAGCAKKEGAEQTTPADLSSDAQKFGYSIGVDLGKSLSVVKGEVDIAALKKGLDETLAGQPPRLDDKQREEIKTTVARKLQQKQMEERAAKAGAAKEAGEKFLAENKKREGVKTTASGLQYEVVTEGKGDKPKASDKVTVHYKGTLIGGEEFDSSYSRGQPITFPLGNVIAGWTEGLQLMTPGSKYKLYIPSNLAYGERGAGAKIGPNEALVFEVELVGVEKVEAAKPAKEAAKKK